MGFWTHVAISSGLLALLALGLNLIVRSGVYSVATAAFYMVGAYATALGPRLGVPAQLATGGGVLLAGTLGLLCITPAFRIREDRLLILTLGFAESLRVIALNWTGLTNGAMGLAGIPPLRVGPLPLASGSLSLAAGVWLAVVVILLASSLLFKSPWGLRLDVSRADETVARVCGVSPVSYRYFSHAAGAGIAAFAGSIYAHNLGFVSPSPFSVVLSVFVLAAVVLGGLGRPGGAVAAAALIGIVQPGLQFIGASSFMAGALRQVLLGGALLGAALLWARSRPK